MIKQHNSLVTVCMPAYNYGRFLEQAVRGIFDQTYRPLELIVIDDGSIDESSEILERLKSESPISMEVINSGHRGVAAAMNLGLRKASGDWIVVAHADDVSRSDRIHELVKRATSGVSLVHSGYTNFDNQFGPDDRDSSMADLPPASGQALRDLLRHQADVRSMTIMFRRSLCVDRGGFDESLPVEDWQLILRMAESGEIAYVDAPLVYRRIHATNLSISGHKKRDPITKADFAFSVLKEVVPPDLDFDQIAARHAAMVIRGSFAMGSWRRALIGIRDMSALFPKQRRLILRLSARGVMSFYWLKIRPLLPRFVLRRLM